MVEIATTHQLYLYQLLLETLGLGKQFSVSQIADIFATNDLDPADVGAASMFELLENLPAFIKITSFKRGRTVITVMRNSEFDEALIRASEMQANKTSTPKEKPWKAKNTKVIIPTKPHPAAERSTAAAHTEPSSQQQAAAKVPTPRIDDAPAVRVQTTTETVEKPQEPIEQIAEASETPDHPSQNVESPKAKLPNRADQRRAKQVTNTNAYATTSSNPAFEIPKRFSNDVYCSDAVLCALSELLPLEANYLDVLDSAWATVMSTEPDLRKPIVFTIPTEVGDALATLRRRRPMPSGRRWELTSVELPA